MVGHTRFFCCGFCYIERYNGITQSEYRTVHHLFDFRSFPTLQSDRLLLREIVSSDSEGVFALRGDYEVTRYNIGAAYTDMSQALDLISGMDRAYRQCAEIRWGITLIPDDLVIGMCGYNYWDRTDHRASIGFDLRRSFWRRGIMREALIAILQFGFDQMLLNRIEADASIDNIASIHLLQSLGFQQEGIQRQQYYEDDQYHDLVLFGLLKEEWSGGEKQNR